MPKADVPGSPFFGRNASVLLDIVRFGAASVVAITHLSVFVQSPHLLPDPSGNAAVCIFFVLSGFVIRFVTVSRETTAREYWIDRTSRIYSVVAPALLLTVLFEAAAFLCNPVVYQRFAQPYHWTEVPQQLLNNLTFTSGFWGYGSQPLSNLPFWSLAYECVYYVLYGLLHYTRTARWFLVPAIVLLVGPSIALLFPVWWMGVLLYDSYNYLHRIAAGPRLAGLALALASAAGAIFHRPIFGLLRATDLTARRAAATHFASATALGRSMFHGATVPWLDRLSISFYFTGIAFSLLLLFLISVLDRYFTQISRVRASRIRLVADSTFTLYLLHVPFFILVFSVAGRPARSWLMGAAVLLAAVVVSVLLAIQFDHLKNKMRALMRGRFAAAAE